MNTQFRVFVPRFDEEGKNKHQEEVDKKERGKKRKKKRRKEPFWDGFVGDDLKQMRQIHTYLKLFLVKTCKTKKPEESSVLMSVIFSCRSAKCKFTHLKSV